MKTLRIWKTYSTSLFSWFPQFKKACKSYLLKRAPHFRKFLYFLLKVILIFLSSIVAASVVTFIGDRPILVIESVTELKFIKSQESEVLKATFSLKNIGRDVAKNITTKLAFIKDGEDDISAGELKRHYEEVFEGQTLNKIIEGKRDNFSEKEDARIIVLIQVEFDDKIKIREIFLNKIFRKQYKINQWCQYIEGSKACFALDKEQFDRYEEKFIEKVETEG